MTGVVLHKPLPTYPNGFPADLVAHFEQAIGRKVIGNKAASGTEIIKELGEEHVRTGRPILYTSADKRLPDRSAPGSDSTTKSCIICVRSLVICLQARMP